MNHFKGGGSFGTGGTGGNAAGAVYVEPGATIQYAAGLGSYNNTATAGAGGFGLEGTGAAGTANPISNSSTVTSNTTALSFVPCYCPGTLIRTARGGVAVEHLAVGDLVVTSSGAHRPVRWLGHRTVDCRNHPRPHEVMPVRVAAGAFGPDRPARDLYLSPQHAIAVTCLYEVLIPVRHLVNGATVAAVAVDTVTYWNVELDVHDILLAENLPCESFLDTQGRVGLFANGAEHAADHPGLKLKTMDDFCRPLVQEGPVVTGVRAQVARRAEAIGWTVSRDPDLHLDADGLRLEIRSCPGTRPASSCRLPPRRFACAPAASFQGSSSTSAMTSAGSAFRCSA